MPDSLMDAEVQATLDRARTRSGALFPSPADWRDCWFYFLLMDRFNNPTAPPRSLPYDAAFDEFQGGAFHGLRERLDYLKDLGVGALWLAPVLKNCAFDPHTYHGYGIQNFLAAEPRFASTPDRADAELRRLVEAAHARGMYVVLDIVLQHAGNVFGYVLPGGGHNLVVAQTDWCDAPLAVNWRNTNGMPDPAWTEAPAEADLDAAVWPAELRRNLLFTCRGMVNRTPGAPSRGDVGALKALDVDLEENGQFPVRNILIRAYQYILARFDVDGFRIDNPGFRSPEFERVFCNAIREFALSAGKKNFLLFGTVATEARSVSRFVGRHTSSRGEPAGLDATLDYPLFKLLPALIKEGGDPPPTPADLAEMFGLRKQAEQTQLASHGEAGKCFITFLDHHDQDQRFGYTGPNRIDDQITLGLACLFTLEGIPCVYYGTEQGLTGHKPDPKSDDSYVREALWGKPDAFDTNHPLYRALQEISRARQEHAVLRYGRLYFRPLSGNGWEFGISRVPSGVVAFSRILNDQEIVVVANTSLWEEFRGEIIVDRSLNPAGALYEVVFSNRRCSGGSVSPGPVRAREQGHVTIREADSSVTDGPIRTLPVTLKPIEVQILRPVHP